MYLEQNLDYPTNETKRARQKDEKGDYKFYKMVSQCLGLVYQFRGLVQIIAEGVRHRLSLHERKIDKLSVLRDIYVVLTYLIVVICTCQVSPALVSSDLDQALHHTYK